MGKREYVIRRLAQIVILYFAIGTAMFILFRFAPGNPLSSYVSSSLTPEQIESMRESFGLDEPVYVQYLKWLQNMATFQFGISYTSRTPVMDVISGKILNTLVLMLASIVFAYIIAIPFGAYLAWNRGSYSEKSGVVLALVSRSAPVFWVGLIALYFLTIRFQILPSGNMVPPGTPTDNKLEVYTSPEFLKHLILPAAVQGFYYFSLPALLMRNSMLEVMNEDFVDFAHLKGVSDRKVMIKHAARNALLPVVTAFAAGAAHAIGASIVIETVFGWPGIGRQIVRALLQNDYPVAQGVFMVMAAFVLVANLIADLAYGYLDPRITYD